MRFCAPYCRHAGSSKIPILISIAYEGQKGQGTCIRKQFGKNESCFPNLGPLIHSPVSKGQITTTRFGIIGYSPLWKSIKEAGLPSGTPPLLHYGQPEGPFTAADWILPTFCRISRLNASALVLGVGPGPPQEAHHRTQPTSSPVISSTRFPSAAPDSNSSNKSAWIFIIS